MNETRGLWRGKVTDEVPYEHNGEWVQGDLICSKYPDGSIDCSVCAREVGELKGYLVDPSTLGECTGLRDKNGKLIFEGDVVKHKADVFEIKYSDEQARFLAVLANGVFNPVAIKNCEIIGNIHDNPELLKGENDEM
ncbi:MAG: hypothetical protein HDT42_09065 [Ruminococcaceae bacterium]|nr:hypothetical protein [Oscillospiraceae bacterium]